MKKLIIVAIAMISFATLKAQKNYDGALGLRFGGERSGLQSGITGKLFLNEKDALEGIANFGFNDGGVDYFTLTALYERHATVFNVPELNGFYGAGAGIAVYGDGFGIGIDAIAGLEYTFPEIPINVSIDVKPYLNVVPEVGLYFNSALSVRYTFK